MMPNYRRQYLGLAPTWEHKIFEVKGPWECKVKKDFWKELVVYCVGHSHPSPNCSPKERGIWEGLICVPCAQGTEWPLAPTWETSKTCGCLLGYQQAEMGHLEATTRLVRPAAGSQRSWNPWAGPGGTAQLTARHAAAVGFRGPQGPPGPLAALSPVRLADCFENVIWAASLAQPEGCPWATIHPPLPPVPPGEHPCCNQAHLT